MPVLERPILRNEWAEQTSERNGIAKQTAPGKVEDAGPWEPAVQEIVGLQNLGDDWDGFGAESPSRDALASAIGLAYCLYQDGVDSAAPGLPRCLRLCHLRMAGCRRHLYRGRG